MYDPLSRDNDYLDKMPCIYMYTEIAYYSDNPSDSNFDYHCG